MLSKYIQNERDVDLLKSKLAIRDGSKTSLLYVCLPCTRARAIDQSSMLSQWDRT